MTEWRRPSVLKVLWMIISSRVVLRGAGTIILIVGGFAFGLGVFMAALSPWAYGLGLWPTLTDGWVGELRTGGGRAQPVYLELQRDDGDGPDNLEGRLRWCDGGSDAIADYGIHGHTENWRGTRFHVTATGDTLGRTSRIRPRRLHADWSGDLMRATGTLIGAEETSTTPASKGSQIAAAEDAQYTLRRGREREFLAACDHAGASVSGR